MGAEQSGCIQRRVSGEQSGCIQRRVSGCHAIRQKPSSLTTQFPDWLPQENLVGICSYLQLVHVMRLCMARAKIVERLGDDFWKRRIEGPLGQKPPREVLDLVTHTLCDGTAGDRSLLWLCAVLLDLRVCG